MAAENTSEEGSKKALIILNPQAGGGLVAEKTKNSLQAAFEELRLDPKLVPYLVSEIEFFEDTPEALQEKLTFAPDTYNRIIAAGGDGTLTSAISVAQPLGKPVGIIPLGTGNRVAKTLKIPTDPKEALLIALTGSPYELDVMSVNGKPSVLIADAGIGAVAMAQANKQPLLKRLLRILAYPLFMFGLLLTAPAYHFKLTTHNRTFEFKALGVAVVNCGDLAGYTIAPGASHNDGLLDVAILAANNRRLKSIIQLLQQEAADLKPHNDGLITFKTDALIIDTVDPHKPIAAQIDGDASGTTPLHIKMAGKISILVSEKFSTPDFCGTGPTYSP